MRRVALLLGRVTLEKVRGGGEMLKFHEKGAVE